MRTKDPSFRALLELGHFLREKASCNPEDAPQGAADPIDELLAQVSLQNAWFTEESCLYAFRYWGEMLREETMEGWMQSYPSPAGSSGIVALILAGNIPLVGFHDLICVLLSGNHALVKCASNDSILLPFLCRQLVEFAPELEDRISFTDGKLSTHDAVIATGSNNTSRYFEFYFSSKPNIIRRNRHGVAVLTGDESQEELGGLADDIFRYYGMGCRSVSKLFVPEQYDFDPFFNAMFPYRNILQHQKYANNYDYNKAVFLMSGSQMLDNGFLLLKEDHSLGSPIGTLFYESYTSVAELKGRLEVLSDQIQCTMAAAWPEGSIPFGKSQWPGLSDYADGVDTMDFLLKLSTA